MVIIPRRPILEQFAILVWFLVSPIRVVTIEISNQQLWVWKNRQDICGTPVLRRRLVDVCNMITANSDNVITHRGCHMVCIRNVVSDICGSSIFSVQGVCQKINSCYGETVGLVYINMNFF